jgi:superfamily II DNA or RNA helicase
VTAPLARTPTTRRPLRAWQAEALQAYREAAATDFLVTATPGAGKTSFALALAAELLERREVNRVVVVAPTDHLRTQWAEAAQAAGILLDPTLKNDDRLRPDVLGYVTTYAQVAMRPAVHRSRTEHSRRTLVVLDEIHHAGDGLSWGEAVAEAFEPARRRVALTGTPFRTRPDERIPFVRYEPDGDDGLTSTADYTYGYRQALADGVVRPVVFAAYTGVSRWRNSAGEVVSASLTGESTRSVEATAWRTALDPGGEWVPHVVAAMDERLTHLREAGMPDAAGLVLASDQDDARAYAAIVRRVTGTTPALILSDDPRASKKISAFASGTERFAVCVRMISEGVDVPRAACLAWMTSYRTPLFFAQAVGRVVRARRPGESATVFLPAVRPLLALAAELESERNHVLPAPAPSDELYDPLPPAEPVDEQPVDAWQALGAEAEFAHVLHGGRAVTADALTGADADFVGLPGLLSPEQTAALLSRRDADHRKRASSTRADEAPTDAELASAEQEALSWRAAGDLRREINSLVGQLAARTGTPHGVVHARVRKAVPGPPSAAAPVDVLSARRDWLLEQTVRP